MSPLLFVIAYDPLLHFVSRVPAVRPFAFADDLALFASSIPAISPALLIISSFSAISGLGINKTKSVAVPTSDPSNWSSLRAELLASPWPDLPLRESGTHLGILIGRDVTLEHIWAGPLTKAIRKITVNLSLLRSLSLSSRILFVNVFIISLFSYISLFFILPTEIWKNFRNTLKKIFPFNGGAYAYSTLVCAKSIFFVKPALRDVWAANISLLGPFPPVPKFRWSLP